MERWNQSRIGGLVTPASARTERRPGQPSVNAVSAVSPVRPTASRARRISAAMSVPAFYGTEHLPAALGRLGVADAHLQVPFALVAAPDERRVQAEGDGRRRDQIGRASC